MCLELDFILLEMLPEARIVIDLNDLPSEVADVFYLEYDFDISAAEAIVRQGHQLFLYHLGDEKANKDLSAYRLAKHVFRNYFHQSIFDDPAFRDKLSWLPNGYRNGLLRQQATANLPASKRKFFASFMGWINNPNAYGNERTLFAQAAEASKPHLAVLSTPGFAGGFASHLYGWHLAQTVLAPCPAGNAAETIRLFDALEMGCIPITTRLPFLNEDRAFRQAPFIFIDHWDEISSLLENSRKLHSIDSLTLEERQLACIQYWRALKESYRSNIRITTFLASRRHIA